MLPPSQTAYHLPVLLEACLEGLALRPDGVYVDLTFGGGGHTRAILNQLGPHGRVLGFDQDPDAHAQAGAISDPRFTLIKANFRHLQRYLRVHGLQQADGILADLGISSHQIDEPARGFSTRFDGPLDMRMNPEAPRTAAEVINTASEAELHKLLGLYGEVKNARTLAAALVSGRSNRPFETVQEFREVLRTYAPRGREFKYFAQVFQAIRMEVNQELAALEEMLLQTPAVLAPGGRLVVMSYHSLEDRLVKHFMRAGDFSGEVKRDFFGNEIKPFQPLSRKPIEAAAAELAQNPRARSARLRVAERLP